MAADVNRNNGQQRESVRTKGLNDGPLGVVYK